DEDARCLLPLRRDLRRRFEKPRVVARYEKPGAAPQPQRRGTWFHLLRLGDDPQRAFLRPARVANADDGAARRLRRGWRRTGGGGEAARDVDVAVRARGQVKAGAGPENRRLLRPRLRAAARVEEVEAPGGGFDLDRPGARGEAQAAEIARHHRPIRVGGG